jgi:HlyD family secretion protein
LASAIVVYCHGSIREAQPVFATARVTRGDVVETVDATGRLQAVTTVQVGTQVSGTIKALHADYNAVVRKGQVIAELEPSLFQAQVEQARASIVRLKAEARRAIVQNEDAQHKLTRARELSARALIPASELETAQMNARQAEAAVEAAEAQIVQAQASLNQAQVNLAHTVIAAPIDGIVISRNVDVGQTVAASMQAPTLFAIARDLTKMQVNASVSESDIGRIEPGQPVSFRVDAYPGTVFTGTVSLVRLDPVIEQNVVSYITTIDVPNREMKLKPGMTANVTIEVERSSQTLRVPNAAIRVRPATEVFVALGQAPPDDGEPADTREHRGVPASGGVVGAGVKTRRGRLWTLRDGRLEPIAVRLGTADATHTAIVAGAVTEGLEVVTAITLPAPATAGPTPSSSPLLPVRPPGPGGRGGPRIP